MNIYYKDGLKITPFGRMGMMIEYNDEGVKNTISE
jgi:hypothetical protein